jgi:hypothetical protein
VTGRSAFLFDEAAVNDRDEDNDSLDDDDVDDVDDDDDDDEEEDEAVERGMSESEFDSDTAESDADDQEETGDISEELVRNRENLEGAYNDHSYSSAEYFSGTSYNDTRTYKEIASGPADWRKKAKYRYSFLYSISVSGVGKKIKNCIPKAVAILSNSKTIILNHVLVMLECLNPALAELCYMDTDSCIFSFTHAALEDNLLPDKLERWAQVNILADESAAESCHGKLKLEGTFRVGFFKALKIYRLFSSREFEREQKARTCYTRCKGVNRNIAKMIPNSVFEKESTAKTVVHRSCLRPSRTGEMLIAHECKSLAAPFNLKRHVTSDGLHSFPVSYIPDDHVDSGSEGGGGGEEDGCDEGDGRSGGPL